MFLITRRRREDYKCYRVRIYRSTHSINVRQEWNRGYGTNLNEGIVKSFSNDELTTDEKGMDELYQYALDNGIKFPTKYQETDTYILTVPTPYFKETKKLNQEYLIASINSMLDVCQPESIIVVESIVSSRSIDKHIRPEIKKRNLVID